MASRHTLYGWHLSYFTGKALSYLRYKQIPFDFKQVNAYVLLHTIKQKTGAVVMPVIKTQRGEWLQDTSDIIDRFEREQPLRPVVPDTPVQRFASYLLEAWGDEWWVPIAMHTRWSYPENYVVFEHDAGKALLPWAPAALQRMAARHPSKTLRKMLPSVGIVPEQFEVMNAWTVKMLDVLDVHFSQSLFLLGSRPGLADFSLVGTMYGHLGRDPWPKRELIEPRTHLKAWLARMTDPAPYARGELLAGDKLPETLAPVFHSVLHEFLPMVKQVAVLINDNFMHWPDGKPLPRMLGKVSSEMDGKPFSRGGLGYMVWMVQRALDAYRVLPPADQLHVRAWLKTFDAADLLDFNWPRVRRDALTVVLDRGASAVSEAVSGEGR